MDATGQKAQSPVAAGQCADETPNIHIVRQQPEIAKREATLISHFALSGYAVHRLADGGFVVARRGLTRHCADFAALVTFARQMGVL